MFDIADTAVAGALAAGAAYADARVTARTTRSIDVQNGGVENIDIGEDIGVGVRALIGSSWGFFATDQLSADAARRAGERAAEIARASARVAGAPIALTDVPIDQATWVTVNDYEAQLLQERTGMSPHEISQQVEALFITRGGKGSQIYTAKHEYNVPAAKIEHIADPTGCGDAYRAGLLYGLMHAMDWETTGRISALMGAIKIERHGTQNHSFDVDEFRNRYRESFGDELV